MATPRHNGLASGTCPLFDPLPVQIVTNIQADTGGSNRGHKQRWSTIRPNMRRTTFIYCSLYTRLFHASIPGVYVTHTCTTSRTSERDWLGLAGTELDCIGLPGSPPGWLAAALCCACVVWSEVFTLAWLDLPMQMKNPIFKVCFSLSLRFLLVLLPLLLAELLFLSFFHSSLSAHAACCCLGAGSFFLVFFHVVCTFVVYFLVTSTQGQADTWSNCPSIDTKHQHGQQKQQQLQQ